MSEIPDLRVEVNERTDAAFRRRMDKEDLNKTTIVNRSVQMYDHLQDIMERGGLVFVQHPGSSEMERLRIVGED